MQSNQEINCNGQSFSQINHLAALTTATGTPMVVNDKFLVQIDSEKNCAFITLLTYQKLHQSQINGIFKLMKVQHIIQNNCRCFVVYFSEKNWVKSIYEGGIQFVCQDETEPTKLALIIVKKLEYMANELRNIAISNKKDLAMQTSIQNNNEQQEMERIQKQRKLLRELKARTRTQVDALNSSRAQLNLSLANSMEEVKQSISISMNEKQQEPHPVESFENSNEEPSNKIKKLHGSSESHVGSETEMLSFSKKVLVPSQKSVLVQEYLKNQDTLSAAEDNSFISHTQTQEQDESKRPDAAENSGSTCQLLITSNDDDAPPKFDQFLDSGRNMQRTAVQKYEYLPHLRYFSIKCYTSVADSIKLWAAALTKEKSLPDKNWFCSVTSQNSTDEVLNIYQLDSTIFGLSFARSIQIFPQGTLDICIESKSCAEYFMKHQKRIETLDDLIQLIHSVNQHSYCTGCCASGYENVSECTGGIRVGRKWYSIKCDKAVLYKENQESKRCLNCSKLEGLLQEQLKTQQMNFSAGGGFEDSSIKYIIEKGKVDIGKTVYNTIGSFWEALQLDDHIKAYKALPPKEKR